MKPQPLSFNRRLIWSLELFWRNLLSQIALVLLVIVGSIAIVLISMAIGLSDLIMLPMQMSGTGGIVGTPPDPFAMMETLFSPMVLVGLLFLLLTLGLLMFWYQAALYQMPVDSLITGERAKLKTVLKKSFIRLPDFMTTVGLVMIIVLLAEVASGLFAAAAGDSIFGIIIGIASLVLIIWLTLSFVMAGPIALLEGHDPIGTLARTLHLVQGMRWRMLGHFFLLALTMIVLSIIAWLPLWLGTMIGGIVAAILGFISFILWIIVTFGIIFVSLFFGESFYFEARAIRGHWKAGWGDVPDESWQLSDIPDDVEVAVTSRGARAWLEFFVLSIILMALTYGSALLLPSPSFMSIMGHSSIQMGAMPHQMGPMGAGAINPGVMQLEPLPEPTTQPATEAAIPAETVTPVSDTKATGTARISLTRDNFWNDDESPSLWLKVSMTGLSLPNEAIDTGKLVRIKINRITDLDGKDIYNRESQMEGEFFQRVNLQSDSGRLHGIRNIHLLKGSRMEDIATISGEVTITLPAEIESFVVSHSDIGNRFEAQALSIELRSMEGKSLAVGVTGLDAKKRFLGAVALTNADSGRQRPRSWGTSENGDRLSFSYDFDNAFNQAELYVANQIVEKSNLFTLDQQSTTIELND